MQAVASMTDNVELASLGESDEIAFDEPERPADGILMVGSVYHGDVRLVVWPYSGYSPLSLFQRYALCMKLQMASALSLYHLARLPYRLGPAGEMMPAQEPSE